MTTEELLQQIYTEVCEIKAKLAAGNVASDVPPQQTWFTRQEVAPQLGKAAFTVREWSRNGRINAQKRNTGRSTTFEWMISADETNQDRLKPVGSKKIVATD